MNKKCIHEPRTHKNKNYQNNTNPKIYHKRPVFSQRVVFVGLWDGWTIFNKMALDLVVNSTLVQS